MGRVLMEGLDASRRVTFAALYLVDADRKGLDLFAEFGSSPRARASTSPRCVASSTR